DAQRSRTWQYILEQTEPLVVIGARSALFSPLRRVGLIVIDESHETAYKQDQAPHYHATNVAAKLAGIHRATMVLGSATPLVSDYAISVAKQRPIVRMTQTATQTTDNAKQITVVDLRDRSHFTKSAYLSNELLAALRNS